MAARSSSAAFISNINFNAKFGWREMTDAVLRVRDSLPPDDAPVGVLTAMPMKPQLSTFMAAATACRKWISGSDSHWLLRSGNPPPKTVIAAGFLRADLEIIFESCELAGHFTIPYGVENSTIGDHTDIFVCRRPRKPWHVFWKRFHWFG